MRVGVGVGRSNVLDLGLLLNDLELDGGLHNPNVMHGLGLLNSLNDVVMMSLLNRFLNRG